MEAERKYTLYVGAFYDVLSMEDQVTNLIDMFITNYYQEKINYINFENVTSASHIPVFLKGLYEKIGEGNFKNIRFQGCNDKVRRQLFAALPDLGLHLSDMVDK